jgi:ornithine carbamoyltransferase
MESRHFLDLSAMTADQLRHILDDAKNRKAALKGAPRASRWPARCWR